MIEQWSLAQIGRWRGHHARSSDGVELGKVEEIIYDYVSGDPIWLGISAPPMGFRTLLAPVSGATVDGEHLRLPYTASTIADQPPVDVGAGWDSLSDEHAIYGYFAVPFDKNGDVRVLHPGEYLPGTETVVG